MNKGLAVIFSVLMVAIFLVGCNGGGDSQQNALNGGLNSKEAAEGMVLHEVDQTSGRYVVVSAEQKYFDTRQLQVNGQLQNLEFDVCLLGVQMRNASQQIRVNVMATKYDGTKESLENFMLNAANRCRHVERQIDGAMHTNLFITAAPLNVKITQAEPLLPQGMVQMRTASSASSATAAIGVSAAPAPGLATVTTGFVMNQVACVAQAIKYANQPLASLATVIQGNLPQQGGAAVAISAEHPPIISNSVLPQSTTDACKNSLIMSAANPYGVQVFGNNGIPAGGTYDVYLDMASQLAASKLSGPTPNIVAARAVESSSADSFSGNADTLIASEDISNRLSLYRFQADGNNDGVNDYDFVTHVQANTGANPFGNGPIYGVAKQLLTYKDGSNGYNPLNKDIAVVAGSRNYDISLGGYSSLEATFGAVEVGVSFLKRNSGGWTEISNTLVKMALNDAGTQLVDMPQTYCTLLSAECTMNGVTGLGESTNLTNTIRLYADHIASINMPNSRIIVGFGQDVFGEMALDGTSFSHGDPGNDRFFVLKQNGQVTAAGDHIYVLLTQNAARALIPQIAVAAANASDAAAVGNDVKALTQVRFGLPGIIGPDAMLMVAQNGAAPYAWRVDYNAGTFVQYNFATVPSVASVVAVGNVNLDSSTGAMSNWRAPLAGHNMDLLGSKMFSTSPTMTTQVVTDISTLQDPSVLGSWDLTKFLTIHQKVGNTTVLVPAMFTACKFNVTGSCSGLPSASQMLAQ